MSEETVEWLNEYTAIGFTDQREMWAGNSWMNDGAAWWKLDGYQNHYPGSVPLEAAEAIIGFTAELRPVLIELPADETTATAFSETGVPVRRVYDDQRKCVVRMDTGTALYYAKAGYVVHQYQEWLLHTPAAMMDLSQGELGIASVGLLRGGGVAYVGLEIPDDMVTPSGFTYRPRLTAATSHDGTMSTGYFIDNKVPVCDNSLNAVRRGAALRYFKKHTVNSAEGLVAQAREALQMFWKGADTFSAEVEELIATEVTNKQFGEIVGHFVVMPEMNVVDGKVRNQAAITKADTKRDEMWDLWNGAGGDRRAAEWKGTALGVLQVFNTYEHWFGRGSGGDANGGAGRYERNMTNVMNGSFAKTDTEVLEHTLALVG